MWAIDAWRTLCRLQYVDEAKRNHCHHFRGTVEPLSVYLSGKDTGYEGQRPQSVHSALLPGWQAGVCIEPAGTQLVTAQFLCVHEA